MPIPIDKLIRSSRKTIALVIEQNGSLMVRAPLRMSETNIRRFVDAHRDWILKHQAKSRLLNLPAPKRYLAGETFLYLGKAHPLHLIKEQQPILRFDRTGFHLSESVLPEAGQVFTRWYRKQARRVIAERLRELAQQHGFVYQKMRISSARTRWGSCSSRGTLSFTWRLVMAPPEVIEYVVIHELVHTRIKNHSREFWGQVAEYLPSYKDQVRWLKQNGKYLTL